ncbi:hypothetical protein LNKW23_44880 [Paralimibaculum aggregatum]|uniref:Uncharacterized protein n=1 Tax=Paralimibaculum aggregatum TaxID=3036245 RepID=A0ABQ6LT53_9RHOB|nr:hypothetical protein [Limibaculum sp. NKW23]GMG85270.1 hypothetical protein LNKW23_44880 [Limibaculum sp. NKW23]
MIRPLAPAALLAAALLAPPAAAGEVEITAARAVKSGETWRFDVTLQHADTGWEHYADAWRVVGPDGTVYGTRTLHHPHVEEQPFTRSLSGVAIPAGVGEVAIEARDSVHGWSAERLPITLRN